MKTVYKYAFGRGEIAEFDMPNNTVVRHVGQDPASGWVALWAELYSDEALVKRKFQIVGTGHEVPENSKFVGTAITGIFVWHVYEVG